MLNHVYVILLALILTVLIELLVALLMGFRNKRDLECIALVNVITNPVFNYFLICYASIAKSRILDTYVFIIELIIVFVEYKLLKKVIKQNKSRILLLSILMNAASYFSGILIEAKFNYIWNLI